MMVDYLKSILPRLQLYSKQLNEEANFVDVPWAFRDGDGAVVTYLFRRNNELLVTKQGEVVTGRWEFIASLRSLLVEYDGRKRLYNQGYLDPEKAVLILRKDSTEELFVLGNKEVIVDMDIKKHIESKISQIDVMEIGNQISNADIGEDTETRTVDIAPNLLSYILTYSIIALCIFVLVAFIAVAIYYYK